VGDQRRARGWLLGSNSVSFTRHAGLVPASIAPQELQPLRARNHGPRNKSGVTVRFKLVERGPETGHENRRFSLFLAINRERTGKILFFGAILALLLDFFRKFNALIQDLDTHFPCYSVTGSVRARNREGRTRNRERTGKEQGRTKHRGFDRHVKERGRNLHSGRSVQCDDLDRS
jgi:hypothetical protein